MDSKTESIVSFKGGKIVISPELSSDKKCRNHYPIYRLSRSKRAYLIAGVCGGIGEAFGYNITKVRVVVALASIFTGGIVIFAAIYCYMWWQLPRA